MQPITTLFTLERISALIAYVVGAVIGVAVQKGQMGTSEWIWAGIAILGVIQLRLMAEPAAEPAAEEA